MTDFYTDTKEDLVKTYRRIHANSEQTHVAIITTGSDDYAAIAYDIDPVEFTAVAAEPIAYDPTLEGVVERAQRWMETHPKGVAGESESSGGFVSKVLGVLGKVNAYGNEMIDQEREDTETPK